MRSSSYKRAQVGRLVVPIVLGALMLTACGGGSSSEDADAPASEGGEMVGDTEQEDAGAKEAPGGIDEELIEAAQDEGEVVIYTAPGEVTIEAWTQPFSEKYGIDVITRGGNSREVHQAWTQEAQAGQHFADIVIHSLPLLFREADEQGLVADFVPSDSSSYPEANKVEGKIYPSFMSLSTFAWNADQVTEDERELLLTQGMDALRDPVFKGRIAMVAIDAGGSQLGEYHHVINELGDAYGWDFMEDLAAQDPVIYESTVPMGQALVAGEFAVAYPLGTTIAVGPILEGAPVEWRYRESPSAGTFYQVITTDAPNPNAARLFTEWAMSLEGQAALTNVNSGISAHADWVDDREIAGLDWYEPFAGEVYVEYAFDEGLPDEATGELYPRWNELFGRD